MMSDTSESSDILSLTATVRAADLEEVPAATLATGQTSGLSLLDMPGEILNIIARLVLVPGEVKAYTSHRRRWYDRPVDDPPNCFNLLVTCKKIYSAYATSFYSENVFYIPGYRITEGEFYFDRLCPTHRDLIRHAAIEFSKTNIDEGSHYDRREWKKVPNMWAIRHQRIWQNNIGLICNFQGTQLACGGAGLSTMTLRGRKFPGIVVIKEKRILSLLVELSTQEGIWIWFTSPNPTCLRGTALVELVMERDHTTVSNVATGGWKIKSWQGGRDY